MTKRSLYAPLALFLALQAAAGLAAQEPPATAGCPACIAMTILPGQVLLLPDDLGGLQVLIRTSLDRTQDLTAGIAAVRDRGGKPAVVVAPGIAGDAAAVLDLQRGLADLRAVLPPDVPIALELNLDLPAATLEAVAPYVDVLITPHSGRSPGRRTWRALGRISLAEAVAATRAADAELWTLELPPDVIEARRLAEAMVRAAIPPPDALVETVDVRAPAPLTAEEIVARHQAVARRQSATVATVISSGSMTLTFEAPGFAAPVTITAETVIYQGSGRTELEQRRIRVNGIEFAGRGVPRLPIIEPERVAAPPLAIVLGRAYRYERDPDETIHGVRCYVVRFAPTGQASAFRGRAWIAVDGFQMVRVAAAQTALRGAIVSSEQVDDFREFAPGVWLLSRSDVRQLYEGAGHRTPIHRVLAIAEARVNVPEFAERVQAAYASSSVMLRDTAHGYRYLSREPPQSAGSEAPGGVVVTERAAHRVRTLAAGVIVDPNISIPLPFAGLNYVDFDLFGTGIQFNGFFGGSYAQMALAAPSIGGSRWQFGGRASAIASSYNDRAFEAGREIFAENIRQRPAHASAWVLRPLGARLAMRAGYEIDYTTFGRAPETSEAFVVPADQVAHGVRLGVEGQRAGWAGSVWWNAGRRAGWRQWGSGTDYDPGTRDFQRFGASVSRTATFVPAFVTRVEVTATGGTDLDRFSRYSFGTFDNRLRGYPAALVRYDRGAVLRGAVAWSLSRFVRVDGFLDTALVRDRGYGTGYRSYTGTGAAVEAPLPFGILGAVEWGFGFRGVNDDGSLGTHVIRVSALKIF
jgi:hypothetical protein